MKITAVLFFFLLANYKVIKNSRQFVRFFESYKGQFDLLDDERAYNAVLERYSTLVKRIIFWVVIAYVCIIILALGI
jgi:hypothetical protein